jgi:hypothetical protein
MYEQAAKEEAPKEDGKAKTDDAEDGPVEGEVVDEDKKD